MLWFDAVERAGPSNIERSSTTGTLRRRARPTSVGWTGLINCSLGTSADPATRHIHGGRAVARATIDDLQKSAEAYDRCWVEGRTDDLRQFLHPKVVFAGPQFERLASGVDACVKTYEGFLAQAKVHAFAPSQYVI